ncbi:MAG: hydrogenase maturation protease [Candidatus Zixiibacteriota bacterium]
MKPSLVLCLGNEVRSDDAFGAAVADRLTSNGHAENGTEVLFAATAGFALLDLLRDRKRVLVVDTIITGNAPPGKLHLFAAGALTPSRGLINSHQMSLPTAVALGKELGLNMPTEISVLAVEAQDVHTLSEQLTPPVEAALDEAVTIVTDWMARG